MYCSRHCSSGTVHRQKKLFFKLRFIASDDSDQDARYALSKLLQRGTVAEYESEFLMLIKRVTRISESLLKSFYISRLKPTLQCALLRSTPTTLDEAFSLARAAEARFTNQQLWELLRSYPSALGEAFFRARITEARFEDGNNQAVDTNVGDQEDPDVKDKQEVKKADDLIENIKDEEGKNDEDQQVSEADDDTNNDDFDCLLPPYKGVDLTVEEVVFENTTSDLKKDEQEVGYNKADGTWVPAFRIEDGWYLFDGPGLRKEPHSKSNYVDRQDRARGLIDYESLTATHVSNGGTTLELYDKASLFPFERVPALDDGNDEVKVYSLALLGTDKYYKEFRAGVVGQSQAMPDYTPSLRHSRHQERDPLGGKKTGFFIKF
ncbi:hypothetical protein Tco_0378465 [Tanacetum coccineum]